MRGRFAFLCVCTVFISLAGSCEEILTQLFALLTNLASESIRLAADSRIHNTMEGQLRLMKINAILVVPKHKENQQIRLE